MSTCWADLAAAWLLAAALVAPALADGQGYPSQFDFGVRPSEQEIAERAIAIPADGKGLPPGSGDYAAGKKVFQSTCAACHGADLQGVKDLPDMPSGAALRLIGGRGTLATSHPVLTVES